MQRKASINRSLFSGLKVGFGLVHAMQSNGPQFKFCAYTKLYKKTLSLCVRGWCGVKILICSALDMFLMRLYHVEFDFVLPSPLPHARSSRNFFYVDR